MKKYNGLDCILLIDDEMSNNYLHQIIIENAEIETFVQVAYDGIEALEFLTCTGRYEDTKDFPQPGIIFLDLNMPKMNGWEFLEEYFKLPEQQKGKIVMAMLTSSLNQDDIDKSKRDENLKGFISKPLTSEKLMDIVNNNFQQIDEGK